MKIRRIIIATSIVAIITVLIAARLISNKRSFEEQLKMVTEFNTTIPVITDTVKFRQIVSEFKENGTFQPARDISLISETQGQIVAIKVKNGDKVEAGQVLALTENDVLKSQLNVAKFNLEKAEKDLHRFEELAENDAATAQQFEMAKQAYINAQSAYVAANTQYENSFIKAPFDGYITKQYIEKGTYLLPGASVFDMVEINRLKLLLKFTADEMRKVKKGQQVKVMVDGLPGKIYKGTISSMVVKADISKHYDVEIDVENGVGNIIKPGMSGTAIFTGSGEEKALVIPRKALTSSIKNPEVFIVKADSVVLKNIEATTLDDKNIIIEQGLSAGDVVVTSGQINLVNGSKITVSK